MLFTGSTTGRIQSFKFPLTLPGEWLEYRVHGDIVSQMKLALDDNRLITASKDGSLCFWQVKTIKGVPPERDDTDFQYAAEILITKSELEDKNRLVFTLQQQVDETKTESEYQLRLKDNKYLEESRMAKKKFNAEVSDLKQIIHRQENHMTNTKKGLTYISPLDNSLPDILHPNLPILAPNLSILAPNLPIFSPN